MDVTKLIDRKISYCHVESVTTNVNEAIILGAYVPNIAASTSLSEIREERRIVLVILDLETDFIKEIDFNNYSIRNRE